MERCDPAKGLSESIEASLKVIREETTRYPGKFAALMLELIQGEGGFQFAPRDYYVAIFEEVRKKGIAVWVDEIQTFGRTGELFAFQKFCLGEYVDVVTAGKMLQACAVIFTEEYKPKPGLVAGTFSGSTVALRTAKKVLKLLDSGQFLGVNGRIERLSQRFRLRLEELKVGSCQGLIREIRIIGGMVGFTPLDGTLESVKSVLMKLYDLGVVAFYCGHGPYLVRMLPPLGVMTEEQIDEVCRLIEQSLLYLAEEKLEKAKV
jgi:4-aminobutyrate aminotransferase-like enzyme